MLTEKRALSFRSAACCLLSSLLFSMKSKEKEDGAEREKKTTFRAQSAAFQHCVALLPFAYNLLLLVHFGLGFVIVFVACKIFALPTSTTAATTRTTTMPHNINHNNFLLEKLQSEHVGAFLSLLISCQQLVNKMHWMELCILLASRYVFVFPIHIHNKSNVCCCSVSMAWTFSATTFIWHKRRGKKTLHAVTANSLSLPYKTHFNWLFDFSNWNFDYNQSYYTIYYELKFHLSLIVLKFTQFSINFEVRIILVNDQRVSNVVNMLTRSMLILNAVRWSTC